MRRIVIGLIGVAVLAALLLLFLRPDLARREKRETPAPPPSAEPPRYRLFAPDESPLAGARVTRFAVRPERLEPRPLGETTTGPDGGIRGDPGLTDGESEVLLVCAAGQAPAAFRPELGELELHLDRSRDVRGVILDLHGRPLAGARVASPAEPPHLVEVRTGENGTFDLGPLSEEAWIRVEAAGRAPLSISLALYPPGAGGVTVTLAPGHRVAGRVVDTRGDPVPGAVVELEQESRSRTACGPDGRFELTGVLPDWEVLLTPFAEGRVGETVNAWCEQRDVVLVLYRPASILGRVVEGKTGFPLPEAEILRHASKTSADGSFRIDGLPPGPTRLTAASGALKGGVTIDLAEGEVRRGVQIALFPPRWTPGDSVRAAWPVTIHALDAGTGKPVGGLPVASVDGRNRAKTGEEGRLTVLLPAGRHRFRVGGVLAEYRAAEVEVDVPRSEEAVARVVPNPEARLVAAGAGEGADGDLWIRSDGDLVHRLVRSGEARFPATPGGTVDLWLLVDGCIPEGRTGVSIPGDGELVVPVTRGATIRGRILESSGRPVVKVGIEIEGLPPDARMETAGDGLFEVGPVLPGRHGILINARNIRTRRMQVEVPPGGLDLGDVRVTGPTELRARVVTSGGAPIPGAVVTTTYRIAAKGVTDAGGAISLPGTESEETLKARADGYLPAWVEIRVPEEARVLPVTFTLVRPARLLVRTVDRAGLPVTVEPPAREDLDALVLRRGEMVLSNLAPGELVLTLTDREGRQGRLRRVVEEGEDGVATVVME